MIRAGVPEWAQVEEWKLKMMEEEVWGIERMNSKERVPEDAVKKRLGLMEED